MRDVHGHGIRGARVFVLAGYHHHVRSFDSDQRGHLLHAQSDERGNWNCSLDVPPGAVWRSYCEQATLIVYARGHAPIFLRLNHPSDEDNRPAGRTSTRNIALVLPAVGASLTVTAIGDWGPLSGGTVRIANEQWPSLYLHHYQGSEDAEERQLLERILRPVGLADAEGVARFDDLRREPIASSRHAATMITFVTSRPTPSSRKLSWFIAA